LWHAAYPSLRAYVTILIPETCSLSLEPWCTFYGLASGAAFSAATACIGARGMGHGLLNPLVGLLAVVIRAASDGTVGALAWAFVLGPLLGAGLGVLVAVPSSLTGDE
jgi:hypothetical protein